MDYQFLLGRSFRIQDVIYTASALGRADGVAIVRATAEVDGEPVMNTFPAQVIVGHLLCDEEIELKEVSFAL
ncbi:MAG: hypothetical protein HC809_02360 [Gammaproteobacteria bacterium]|nr:hypothetical protein [Gammaproteobacteria bacterium]